MSLGPSITFIFLLGLNIFKQESKTKVTLEPFLQGIFVSLR